MSWEENFTRYQSEVNEALSSCFTEECSQKTLLEAMRYSLLAGGKRIRPILVLAFCEACGGDPKEAVSAACGIEMLHTYSLIHDDLPCMDNDDLRRGRPTCHKVYGETNAVLAGDALQASAFTYVLSGASTPERKAAMALTLSRAAGEMGMCGGQYLDIRAEEESVGEEDLLRIHALKTGALLRAACVMGAQCAGAGDELLCAAAEYAENIGLAFQIRDDVLDRTSTKEVLGKTIGSDEAEGKTTFVTLFGVEECDSLVRQYTERAKAAIADILPEPGFLLWLADLLSTRKK